MKTKYSLLFAFLTCPLFVGCASPVGEGRYENGLRQGDWVWKDEAGKPLAEGRYEAGKEVGKWMLPPFDSQSHPWQPYERWIGRLDAFGGDPFPSALSVSGGYFPVRWLSVEGSYGVSCWGGCSTDLASRFVLGVEAKYYPIPDWFVSPWIGVGVSFFFRGSDLSVSNAIYPTVDVGVAYVFRQGALLDRESAFWGVGTTGTVVASGVYFAPYFRVGFLF